MLGISIESLVAVEDNDNDTAMNSEMCDNGNQTIEVLKSNKSTANDQSIHVPQSKSASSDNMELDSSRDNSPKLPSQRTDVIQIGFGKQKSSREVKRRKRAHKISGISIIQTNF